FACSIESGSDPAAYAALEGTGGQTLVGGVVTAGGPLAKIPALANLEEQDLGQDRLGMTTSLQWRPSHPQLVSLDMVYSRFTQSSEVNQLQTVGLNRNNTTTNFQTTAALTVASRRGVYATCTAVAATAFRDPLDCSGTQGVSAGVFAGLGTTSFST